MRRRSERTLKELYDRTGRISEAEITPILKGSCRIQGPVDSFDLEFRRTNSDVIPIQKKFTLVTECTGMRIQSGTCNVCSAPCSSCMHYQQSLSVIGSNSESGCSGNICARTEADSHYSLDVNGTELHKSRLCDDSQNAASETSNMVGMSSSHNSDFGNAESKKTLGASVAHDFSDDAHMHQTGSSGEFVRKHQPLEEKNDQAHLLSASHISSSGLGCIDPLGQGEEQHVLECHGDNISCITGRIDTNIPVHNGNLSSDMEYTMCSTISRNGVVIDANGNSYAEAGDDLQGHGTKEGQRIFRKTNATADAPLLNEISNSASVNTTPDNSGFPLPKVDVSPCGLSLDSQSKSACSSVYNSDLNNTEEKLNLELQVENMKCAKMDNAESMCAGSLAGRKPSVLSSNVVYRGNEARSCLASDNSKADDLSPEIRTDTDSQSPSCNGSKGIHVNNALERENALLDFNVTNDKGCDFQPLGTTECEKSESDGGLLDVKVCDICGDAGREELLAICSRCSDGAEHTYCMQEMLDRVPGDNWLCEECKIKEVENQNLHKSDIVSGRSKPTCLNESTQNFISTSKPKQLPKLDARVIDLDTRGLAKGLESPKMSTRRQADLLEGRKASELGAAPTETANQRKTLVLSRLGSFKNQETTNVKIGNMEASSEGHYRNNLQASHRLNDSLSSGYFKGQSQLHSSRGHFSRSVSFNSNIKQKVKQLVEDVPYKQKITREAMSSNLRTEGLVNSMVRSASFKMTSSGCSNTESSSKTQFVLSAHIENPRGLNEVKERITVEKKNSSTTYSSFLSPSAAPANNFPPKVSKSPRNELKVKSVFDSSVQGLKKRPCDASDLGCHDRKKRNLNSSKCMESSTGKFDSDNRKQCQGVMQTGFIAVELYPKDDKMKDSNTVVSSRLGSSGGTQSFHCKKCNETGHATQQCSTGKIEGSVHNTSAEQSSKESMKKEINCEDAVNTTISKSTMIESKELDNLEKLPAVNGNVIFKDLSRKFRSPFFQRNMPLVECNSNGKDSLKKSSVDGKAVAATDSENPTVQPAESLFVPGPTGLSGIPTHNDIPIVNQLNVEPFSETSPEDALLLANSLSPTIPKLECIWQGSFSVLRSESHPQLFDGIQAHVSTCASHRVLEIVNKFPIELHFEEVSHTCSWPLKTHRIGPKEENIALFFFAKDSESYENSYGKLLDKMLKDNLALRGKVEETDFFIFTSNKLPVNSQRWNRLYYLWGMFIVKSRHCLPEQKQPSGSNLSMDLLDQGISALPNIDVSNVQNLNTIMTSKPFSECDTSSKIKKEESNNGVDLYHIASDVEHKACRTEEASFIQKSLNQIVADTKMPQEIPSLLVRNLSRTTAKTLDAIDNPESQLQMPASQLCYAVKIESDCQDKFFCDRKKRTGGELPAHASDTAVEANLIRALSVPSISPNYIQGTGEGCSKNEVKMIKRESLLTNVTILDYEPGGNLLEIAQPSCQAQTHEHLCSTETVHQSPGKMPKSSADTMLWREGASWMQSETYNEREKKMTCCTVGSGFGNANLCSRLSSKVHPLYSTISGHQYTQNLHSEPVISELSRTAERCFFPLDVGLARNNKHGNTIHILSSEDEVTPESNTPDLLQALNCKNESTKPAELPLLPPTVARGSQHEQPGPSGEDGDDISASLSLSLGFAVPDKETSAKCILRTEQLLLERPSVKSSLFLFGHGIGNS